MSRLLRLTAVLSVAALAAISCGSDDTESESATTESEVTADLPVVLATTSILGDITENVVGDLATVQVLMPPGTDPHDFEPSAQQMAELLEADLVIANGLLLEEGLIGALEQAEDDGVPVIELAPALSPIEFGEGEGHTDDHDSDDHDSDDSDDSADGHDPEDDGHGHGSDGDDRESDSIETTDADTEAVDTEANAESDESDGHDHGDLDPHVWMDVDRMATAATMIAEAVAEHTDIDAGVLDEQATAYIAELAALDEEIQALLEPIPADNRLLVTNHEALGYFADRYGFELVGTVIPSGSTLAEPSAAGLAELAATIDDLGITAIFAENVSSTDLAEALAREVDAQVVVVELFTDSLGDEGTGAETYIGLMRTNAELISEALS